MKKKMILLISACLILTVELSKMDVSAAELFRWTVMSDLSGSESGDTKLPDGEAKPVDEASDQENGEAKPEDGAPGQKSEGTQPEKDNDENTQAEDEPYKTSLSIGLLLYKGDTTSVGIRYFKTDMYQVVSSNPSVVKVGKKGKIKALKCGKADITAALENDTCRAELVLHVRVKASSYAKTASHGKGVTKMKRMSQTGLVAYQELAPGKTLRNCHKIICNISCLFLRER